MGAGLLSGFKLSSTRVVCRLGVLVSLLFALTGCDSSGDSTLVSAPPAPTSRTEAQAIDNLLDLYSEALRQEDVDRLQALLRSEPIERESLTTATVDSDAGLGVILGPQVMQIAIDKAKTNGIGMVTLRGSGHMGAVGHHAMLAAEEDMVGMCMTASSGLNVVPTFASKPMFSTNPISIAAPAGKEAPVYFDIATSAIAGNKIRLAMRVESPLLPGWLSDTEGNPLVEDTMVTDRSQVFQLLATL